jgi:hypothetical protein
MIKEIIRDLDEFDEAESKLLISIVDDVYFYWDKFEIIDDAVEIIFNFYKPKPLGYYSPLSKFPRLDHVFNYHAYVVAFFNLSCFFEPNKKRKDDRILKEFLKRCSENSEILYNLKVALYKERRLSVPYKLNDFKKKISDLGDQLSQEIKKEYIKEIKRYRDKVLGHHTFFDESNFSGSVSNYLMNAKKFFNPIVKEGLGEIITLDYKQKYQPLIQSINQLRETMKPNLKHIIKGEIIFPQMRKDELAVILSDHEFNAMLKKFSSYSIVDNSYGSKQVDFELRIPFYTKNSASDVNSKFVSKTIFNMVKKYSIEGTKVKEEIIDH